VIEVKRNSGVLVKQSSFVSRDYELGDLVAEEVQINPFITALHILIVDDSRLNRKMVSKFLKGDDYLCDEAEDGLEAIRMVKENFDKFERGEIRKPYHAILMDYTVRGC
jgi:PleD family two-component response regulator